MAKLLVLVLLTLLVGTALSQEYSEYSEYEETPESPESPLETDEESESSGEESEEEPIDIAPPQKPSTPPPPEQATFRIPTTRPSTRPPPQPTFRMPTAKPAPPPPPKDTPIQPGVPSSTRKIVLASRRREYRPSTTTKPLPAEKKFVYSVPADPEKEFAELKEPQKVVTQAVADYAPAKSYKCPEPNGFFADSVQCDKYYECRNGKMAERLCPDGLVFNDAANQQEKCDLPINIDCSKRPKLQPAIPSTNCPRHHGYFSHKDPSVCGTFFYCIEGRSNELTCPPGLVFNDRSGTCTWPDEAKKRGCGAKEVFKFRCPKVTRAIASAYPRYADPGDCQFYFVCVDGNVPRRQGCRFGQVFDDVRKVCEWPRKVPECADWYKDRLTDAELESMEKPSTPAPKILVKATTTTTVEAADRGSSLRRIPFALPPRKLKASREK